VPATHPRPRLRRRRGLRDMTLISSDITTTKIINPATVKTRPEPMVKR
jgi:hypothetical protein